MIFLSCDYPNIGIFKRDKNGDRTLVKMIQHVSDTAIDDYYHVFHETFQSKQDTGFRYVHFHGSAYECILLPCGRCTGCRLEYSRQWAIRCTLEALQHECNYFVTLTYDDANLPKMPYRCNFDPETGEVFHDGQSTPLVPDHLKNFIKRLRSHYKQHFNTSGIRFFACGEYGGKTARPHYHVIFFNLPILDLKLYKKNFQDKPLYNSETIDKLWKMGYSVIAECNFDTCAYVARYIMKKQTGKNFVVYSNLDITPEFTRMSRKPGIGRTYYDENRDKIYTYDQITLLGADGKAISPCPPRYFDKIYADEEPDEFNRIKEERLIKQSIQERSRELQTGISKASSIHMEQRSRDRAIIALKRAN